MTARDSKAERDARLAAALRANLRRRKVTPPVADAPPPVANPGEAAEPDQWPIA